MSGSSERYSFEQVQDLVPSIRDNEGLAVDVIEGAAGEEVIQYLVEEEEIDTHHDGERGIGEVRQAILKSELTSTGLKRKVATRGDQTPDLDVLVPEKVKKSAVGALQTGKPVVLYGPTGTGKTTFAKQLALSTSIGYTLDTASPSWTSQDIVGKVAPDYSSDSIGYKKELGCVSEAVVRSREYGESYSVIIDELTRADISKIFGPLYTAIENPHQTIFTTDNDETVQLDPEVNIICTMNMSDRTVNQLDNAITRRFAMIEVSSYSEDAREKLFTRWVSEYMSDSSVNSDELLRLFRKDYTQLNSGSEDDETGIIDFGPMHYEDVASFVGTTTSPNGVYRDEPSLAVGEAFRTYIMPRLLNSATYSQVDDLVSHYQELDREFGFELQRATDLAQSELQSEKQRMGARD